MEPVSIGFIDGAEWIREKTLNELKKRMDIIEDNLNPDFLVYSIGSDAHYMRYNGVRIFYTEENIRPDFNLCDYAAEFSYMQFDDRYLRIPNYYFYTEDYELARIKHLKECGSIKEKKFCNFVYSNSLHDDSPRNKFFDLLSEYKQVDSGGRFRNNIGGTVKDKIEFQKQYKFSIAFENASFPGYTTEKILQAFAAGTIPIYYGNPDIEKEFNGKAFINCHKYGSLEEVVKVVKEIDNNDELYNEYLKQAAMTDMMPINPLETWIDYLENIILNGPKKTRRGDGTWNERYIRMEECKTELWYYINKCKLLELGAHWLYNHRKIK